MNRIVSGHIVPPRAFIPGLMLPGVSQIVNVDKKFDPVDAILISRKSFKQTAETLEPQVELSQTKTDLKKVMTLLLKEVNNDICKLLDLVRKLNARQEYARLAQMMLSDIFSRVDPDELLSSLKKESKIKHWQELMDSCEIYGLKHYVRADKNLKQSFYLQYVMS